LKLRNQLNNDEEKKLALGLAIDELIKKEPLLNKKDEESILSSDENSSITLSDDNMSIDLCLDEELKS